MTTTATAETSAHFDVTLRYANPYLGPASPLASSISLLAAPTANAAPAPLDLKPIELSKLSANPVLFDHRGLFSGLSSASSAEDLSGRDKVNTDVTSSVADLNQSFSSLRGDAVVRPSRRDVSGSDANFSAAVPISNLSSNSVATLPTVSSSTEVSSSSVSELVTQVSKTSSLRAAVMAQDRVASVADNTNSVALDASSAVTTTSDNWLTVLGPNSVVSPGGLGHISKTTFDGSVLMLGGTQFQLDVQAIPGSFSLTSDTIAVQNGIVGILASPSTPITVSLYSLTQAGTPGPLNGFYYQQPYSWNFLTAPLILGFQSNDFVVDTSHFLNATGNGNFFVSQNGNSLTINFTPVP